MEGDRSMTVGHNQHEQTLLVIFMMGFAMLVSSHKWESVHLVCKHSERNYVMTLCYSRVPTNLLLLCC